MGIGSSCCANRPISGRKVATMLIEDARTGTLFLFFNKNVTAKEGCKCSMSYVVSTDEGASWSNEMNDIPAESGVVGSALASGITHSKSGRLIACMRKICRNSCPADYHSKAMFSDDHGKSWKFATSWVQAQQSVKLPS